MKLTHASSICRTISWLVLPLNMLCYYFVQKNLDGYMIQSVHFTQTWIWIKKKCTVRDWFYRKMKMVKYRQVLVFLPPPIHRLWQEAQDRKSCEIRSHSKKAKICATSTPYIQFRYNINPCVWYKSPKIIRNVCNHLLQWDNFSTPELGNFLRVLDREENEYMSQLEYKYKVMRRLISQRMKEIRKEKHQQDLAKRASQNMDNATWIWIAI